MTERDLLILVIYVIVVVYVLYKAVDSLEAQTAIAFERDVFDRQLEERDLVGLLDVKFKFEDRYNFDEPKTLAFTLDNKFEHSVVYVDWDRCSLSDYTGRSRRVIRMTAEKKGLDELFQPQMFSTATPGSSLNATLTAEELLKFVGDTGTPAASAPLVDIGQLQKSAKSPKATEKQKQMHADFMSSKAPLRFTLQLALRVSDVVSDGDVRFYVFTCNFAMRKVPWYDALPFNPKK